MEPDQQESLGERDHGLVGLGLVMQLGGDLLLAFHGFLAVLLTITVALAVHARAEAFLLTGWAVVGAIRAAAYRSAGASLLYGGRLAPAQALLVVGAFALAQMALLLDLLRRIPDVPSALRLGVIAGELAWPALLLATCVLLGQRRPLPPAGRAGDGYGLDAVPVLMIAVGALGLTLAAALLAVLAPLALDGGAWEAWCVIALIALGAARAADQLLAGVQGLRAGDASLAEPAVLRYVRDARILGAIMIALALVIAHQLLPEAPKAWQRWTVIVVAGGAFAYAALAWPGTLKRIMVERHADAWAEGHAAPAYVSSRDGGLSALGWLLAGFAVIGLTSAIGAGQRGLLDEGAPGLGLELGLAAHLESRRWLAVGGAALQLWAGLELAFASPRARVAAILYGLAGSALVLVAALPQLRELRAAATGAGPLGAAGLATVALSLALPVTTLALALRRPRAA